MRLVNQLLTFCARCSCIDSLRPTSTFLSSSMAYSKLERGNLYTKNYALYITDGQGPISPFHDIPLYADKEQKIFNMVVEIPRWTNAKMEMATKELLNPIKQDVKKDEVRFVKNCFPHHGYIWNYGALPQTWEDPNKMDEATKQKGDNDPIDVCEIGYRIAERGDIIQIKVLGILALIDEGETDWKVIGIDTQDPLAASLNDIHDICTHMPGLLEATVEWFRIYKRPDGKPYNEFAFDGKAQGREFAEKIIEETHNQWKALINKEVKSELEISTVLQKGPNIIAVTDAIKHVSSKPPHGPAAPLNPLVNKWYYIAD